MAFGFTAKEAKGVFNSFALKVYKRIQNVGSVTKRRSGV